ncbi:DNA repair and recombination protein RAD54B-like [Anopheles moucheti]|uniref:DNA repair and recombination protein RAD54B-like n=1 Tax=Anopheles moucheti TaxID=186751 RepID=UPI0022F14378|nr:DNA repair and recombination protein RAD54B-like [Anopheles moucheti]
MRRSCAPSMKRTGESTTSELYPAKKATNTVGNPIGTGNNQDRTSTTVTKDTNLNTVLKPRNSNESDSKTIFKVVWGKISTRKHKTWEGDGTLEVSGRSAVLKDENGRVITTASGLKIDEVTEGIQLVVGSKEVEVLEKCNENQAVSLSSFPSSSKICTAVPSIKRFKPPEQRVHDVGIDSEESKQLPKDSMALNNGFTNMPDEPVARVKTNFKSHYSTLEDAEEQTVEPLIMKKPSFEHQFKHNVDNEPVSEVVVPHCLTRHLRPHQREGVAFLYECVTGLRMLDPPGYGAILADEMGLGKTLQCIALMYTLMKTGPYGKPLAKRILIVTPSSLVDNWDREINKWLRNERIFTFIVGPNNKLKRYAQSPHIPILIISYEMLSKQIAELETVRFDLMFCDEGHRLKNSNVKAFGVLNRLDCKRRVLLTGTPIQNDLQEFFSLINFVNPGIIGTYQDFKARYETPIIISQRPGVLPQSIELGIERLNELNAITDRFMLRRTQEVINQYLPDKHEVVILCQPSDLQTSLTHTALTFYESQKSSSNAISPLQLITILKKICNHPSLVSVQGKGDPESLVHLLSEQLPPWQRMGPSDSAKLGIVEALLEAMLVMQEKIVIVSYYGKTLDMIAGLCEHYNYKYCRLDGSTAGPDRYKIVTAFNNAASDCFILLLSAKAGGAGLNLVGASRLVLYDNDWNPANDLQAMSRVWRDGQRKPVFIYRLLTAYSIEERIFQRQISKTSLSGTVVDQRQNLSNLKLSDEELKDLFSMIDPNAEDDCLTHSLLECSCAGIGNAPDRDPDTIESCDSIEDLLTEREKMESRFQLRPLTGKRNKVGKTKFALKMQELMRWEHHRSPVSESVLEQLGLSRTVDEIVFLFRNIVSASK